MIFDGQFVIRRFSSVNGRLGLLQWVFSDYIIIYRSKIDKERKKWISKKS